MSLDPNRHDPERNDMLARIQEGMKVVDVNGDEIGTVDFVQMADPNDPEGTTAGRDEIGDAGLLDLFDPDQGGDVTERMLQRGFLRIDGAGLFSGTKHVIADHVAAVEGDTVRLSLDKDEVK